ncbi:MAG: quinone-interacting membrane-bound oxidoreductase complex subunit QmoC [Desulfobacterales bacterium]|jgi:quinone-modifying oxidoreductase subunit QmoC|nr:quinone-interacting membrane-bound oxidoreductase complex subunit QmoC [Desulfobacterales bacterium]
MAERYLADPDISFIQDVIRLGGADVKKCFQCATCSVACPISPENKPFPRKEMIATAWGLKDKLIGNADIWLCHNCGDCTTRCPRGAKPGDVLAAVRAYAVSDYATPKVIAKAVQDPKKLPILLAIPAVIILVVGLILKMFGVDWLNFAPTGDHLWQADYIGNLLVDIIMVPTFMAAIVVFALGLKRFLADIHANALAEGKTDKETIDPKGFGQAFLRILPTIATHKKFNECTENVERSTAHMMVLFGFIGLFIVTGCFFAAEWIFHIDGPYSQINPIKWLANVAGIALVIGGFLLLKNRLANTKSVNSYWDWSLVGLVLGLGVTGMLTEMLRLGGLYDLSAIVYFLHLIFVWSLFAYTPFSKLAHLVYRTVAMTYMEYAGRK